MGKKKKERAEALKSKRATGARNKENQKGEEIKVVRRSSATAEPSDMMVMKLSLVMEEAESFRESVERKGADLSRALLRGRVRLGMAEERCADDAKRIGTLAKCDASETELLQKLEEADLGILRRKEELVSLQDSIGRRRDALWAIHPALVSLQEEDVESEKNMEEEKKEEGEEEKEEKHFERVEEKVVELPAEEKEKREGMAWLELVEERSKLSFDEVLGIVTKNKKKKERAEALKSKRATGARNKENQKGEEIKVVRRSSAP